MARRGGSRHGSRKPPRSATLRVCVFCLCIPKPREDLETSKCDGSASSTDDTSCPRFSEQICCHCPNCPVSAPMTHYPGDVRRVDIAHSAHGTGRPQGGVAQRPPTRHNIGTHHHRCSTQGQFALNLDVRTFRLGRVEPTIHRPWRGHSPMMSRSWLCTLGGASLRCITHGRVAVAYMRQWVMRTA